MARNENNFIFFMSENKIIVILSNSTNRFRKHRVNDNNYLGSAGKFK